MTPLSRRPRHSRSDQGPRVVPQTRRLRSEGLEFGLVHSPKPAPTIAANPESTQPAHAGTTDTPIFVIVHGIGTSHRYSVLLHQALATHGATYSVDLPGFGGMETPRHRLAVEDYARLLGSVLDTLLSGLQPRRCVLIGHSMGAQITTELAAQRPNLVAALVLIGPVTDSRRSSALAQAVDLCRDTLKEPVAANLLVFADYTRCGPRWYTQELVSMLAYATADQIVHVAAPVLVVRGADDPVSRSAWCASLVRQSGHGFLKEIAGHRHLVHYSAAERVADSICRFVQRS